MSLPTTLGAYPVERELGRGGMGVVYLARDPRLNRQVAIKVLPDAMAFSSDSLARFEREAKLLASLNHPNIATVFGLEQTATDGQRLLVLEYVPGDTLAVRIARGPLPLDEALDVCRQIALAVEAAHDGGVIHRDLKPGNVKITPDGHVKVLDFGLAKGADPSVSGADLALSPTLTYAPTGMGVILGTAGYMSPEQARGKPGVERADWEHLVIGKGDFLQADHRVESGPSTIRRHAGPPRGLSALPDARSAPEVCEGNGRCRRVPRRAPVWLCADGSNRVLDPPRGVGPGVRRVRAGRLGGV